MDLRSYTSHIQTIANKYTHVDQSKTKEEHQILINGQPNNEGLSTKNSVVLTCGLVTSYQDLRSHCLTSLGTYACIKCGETVEDKKFFEDFVVYNRIHSSMRGALLLSMMVPVGAAYLILFKPTITTTFLMSVALFKILRG